MNNTSGTKVVQPLNDILRQLKRLQPLSTVASIATIIAFIFAIGYAVWSGQKTTEGFRLITDALKLIKGDLVKSGQKTTEGFRLITDALVKMDRRIDEGNRRTNVNWVLNLLEEERWSAYQRKIANLAIDSEPRYLKNRKTFELTEKGRDLLDSSIMEHIEVRVEHLANQKLENGEKEFPVKKKIPCNRVLRGLDLMDLSVKAEKKGVSLDIMLAVSNGYANEEKGAIPGRDVGKSEFNETSPVFVQLKTNTGLYFSK